ncbi:SpaH/EbpB family LPXTG-anchored major pilin [Arcanobacterium phocae]|uniref:SpaH/EbpB family LPXTG-anchored major pilin n=1 Tax=Arcanobacterium phocae TaxID=131112 RepID=UPI001C124558
MFNRKNRKRGLFTAISLTLVAALGFAGVPVALAAPALGDMPTDGGTITIHKYDSALKTGPAGDGSKLADEPDNTKLGGVTFTITPVKGIDLNKNEDWAKIKGGDELPQVNPAGTKVTLGKNTFDLDSANKKSVITEEGTGSVRSEKLNLGVYLIQETDTGKHPVTKKTAPFFVTVPMPGKTDWITDIHVYPKNDLKKDSTKEVSDGANLQKVGDEIPWTITTTPSTSNPKAYGVVDRLQAYLDYVQDSAAVTINGVPAVQGDFEVSEGDTPSKHVKIVLTEQGRAKVKAGEKVVFTLKTKLNALPGNGVVKNDAFPIDGDYNPFEDPKQPQPPIVPTEDPTYGQYKFNKVDAQSNKALSGATFNICADKDCKKVIDTATSDNNGIVNFEGIYLGKDKVVTEKKFWLKETKAPAGYVLDAVAKEITITPGTHEINPAENVKNTKQAGPNLPMTGAAGTVLLTLAGVAVFAIATGLAFVNKRRKNA